MSRIFSLASRYFLPVCLPVLPFLGLVWTGIEQLGQAISFAAALGVACLLAGISLVRERSAVPDSPGMIVAFAAVPLFIMSVVSAVNVGEPSSFAALFGRGGETGSIASYLLIALCVILCAGFAQKTRAVFLHVFLGTAAVASVIVLILWAGVTLFSPIVSIAPFTAFLLSLASVGSALLFDAKQGYRAAYASVSLLSLAAFYVLFHSTAAAAGIGAVIAYIAYAVFKQKTLHGTSHAGTIFIGAALAVMLTFGSGTSRVDVPVDIRPSFLATGYIIGPEYTSSLRSALLGTGPGSLPYAWNFYRPIEFNMGARWDATPPTTYSTASTIAIELGVLGLLAFVLIPIALVFRLLAERSRVRIERSVVALIGLSIFTSALFYAIDLSLILLAAGALGLSISAEAGEGNGSLYAPGRRTSIGIAIALIVMGCVLFVTAWQQGRAALYDRRGHVALEQNDDVRAARLFDAAVAAWPSSSYLRDASLAHGRVFFIKAEGASTITDVAAPAKAEANKAVSLAERASDVSRSDLALWVYKASLYTSLAHIGFKDAKENAHAAFAHAQTLAPTRPDVPYMRAVFHASTGDMALAEEAARKALSLKADFESAAALLQQIGGRTPNR